jgi:polysaccharide deacetylase family protein (PEP-CTERM system associated)
VVVEDYFHHAALSAVIHPDRWRRFETRVERNTRRTLDLLDEFNIKATFFTLGWIAERMPGLIREISTRGHEVASKGYYHRSIQDMSPAEFRKDLLQSRDAIENATGVKIHGYRVARGTFTPEHKWALHVLCEEGFAYDSSFYPRLRSIAREPWRRHPHQEACGDQRIWEIPLSSIGPSWFTLPVAGGNYFRQLPNEWMQRVVAHWDRTVEAPFTLYFHVWELDPDLPRIEAIGRLARIRQYRNLDLMEGRLRHYFGTYAFESIAARLGLDTHEQVAEHQRAATAPIPNGVATGTQPRTPVTVVVPAHNEELAIPYLANTLEEFEADLGRRFDLRYVFVDDGSSDRTWDFLGKHFGSKPGARLVRLQPNRGVAEAILAGIREADTDIVCSIDCDCTYDPRQLGDMIPMLGEEVSMVTASPYHPEGRVLNVPAWRLSLSKGLSFLYRRVLRNRLYTYTACVRVYRRKDLEGMTLLNGNFLGVLETLARLDLAGRKVVECPAVLEVRMLGYSKMKVIKTIRGHLGLLLKVARARWNGRPL